MDPATTVCVKVLGPLQVSRGAGIISVGATKQRAVFARLALNADDVVSYEQLLAAVWGERRPTSARQLLHTYVARLRQALEPETRPHGRHRVIASAPSGYRLLVGGHVDVVRFRHIVALADARLAAGDWSRALDLLGEGLRLWRDPLLTELRGLLRVSYELDALQRDWTAAALRYVTIGLEHDLAGAVLSVAERLADIEPLHEEIQARYLSALEGTGQRAAAIERFGEIRARLAGDLGIEPGPALTAMYRRLLAGVGHRSARAVRAATADATPRPPWRGIGPGPYDLVERDRDRDLLVTTLTYQRLVTIAGPPGCGKSALALHTAARVRDSFAGGVAVMDLSRVHECSQVIGSLLDLLGAPARGDVADVIGDRQLLLVLDNAEHIVEALAGVADHLMRRCGHMSVIVTSREPLGLPYESVYRVSPLPVPPTDLVVPAGENPAMELFARRAALVRPGFRIGPDNVTPVATICRRLDGVPLALEIAAASLATDSLDAVVGKLDDPLHRIQPPRRGWPPHQKSLHAALSRSLDCLTQAEHWVFQRLGGLPPHFSLVEAQRECEPVPGAGSDLTSVLARLVDKSLLLVSHGPGGPMYRMLGIVHRLAVELRLGEHSPAGSVPAY